MLNLQLVEKQRARLYKNELRRQFEQKEQLRKNQSMQLRSKDQQELEQKMQIVNEQVKSEKQRQVYISNQLRQENMLLATLKNQNRQLEESFVQEIPLKGNNVMQTLYKHNEIRDKQYKNVAKTLSQSYHQQQNLQKQHTKQTRHKQITQDIKHLETLKQLQTLRKKQYQEIKNKHSPEPKRGEIHKKMQQLNEQYKKSLQSFAYNGRDILDSLKRDETKQILQKNKRVQSQLKYQIQEKKTKQSIQKQQYLGQPSNLQKSILGSLFFKDSNFDKRQYGNYLMKQINETDLRRSTEKVKGKEKVQIGSIFGGQNGPERLKMIKYIDKNLGIQSEYLKNIEPGNKQMSPFRVKNLYEFSNGDITPTMSSSMRLEDRIEKKQDNPEKKFTSQMGMYDNRQKKAQSLSINDQTIRLSSSRVGQSNTPKSYLGYDLIKGTPLRYEY